jgi:hypothetical protein
MINSSGVTKAQPGALNSTGNAFGVTWEPQFVARIRCPQARRPVSRAAGIWGLM